MIHERILAAAARLAEVICFHQQQRLSSRRQQEGRQGQCLILPSNHSIYILLRPVISCSRALRSSGKYISHFVQSELFCHSNSRWFVLLSFPNKGGKWKNMDLTRCCFWKMLIDKLCSFHPQNEFVRASQLIFYFSCKLKNDTKHCGCIYIFKHPLIPYFSIVSSFNFRKQFHSYSFKIHFRFHFLLESKYFEVIL